MKKILLTLIAVVAAGLSAFADELIERDMPVHSFVALRASSFFDITLKNGPAAVKLTCSPEIFEYVSVKVENGTLELKLQELPKNFNKNMSKIILKAEVSVPEILSIDLSGASKLTFATPVGNAGKLLSLILSGGSRLNNQFLSASAVKAIASGASVIEMKGRAENMKVDASGASELFLDLDVDAIKAEVSGASRGRVELDCNAAEFEFSGAAKLTIAGNAKAARLFESGAAIVTANDFEVESMYVDLSGASIAKVHPTKAFRVSMSGGSKCYYSQTSSLLVKETSVTGGSSLHLL